MFTRKIPYLGATPAYIRQNVKTGIMRPSTAPLVSEEFIPVVRNSWAQNPAERCTLSQLRVMLEAAAAKVDGVTQIGELRPLQPRQSRRRSMHRTTPSRSGHQQRPPSLQRNRGSNGTEGYGSTTNARSTFRARTTGVALTAGTQLFDEQQKPLTPPHRRRGNTQDEGLQFSTPSHERSRRRVRTVSGIPFRQRESSQTSRSPLLQPLARGVF